MASQLNTCTQHRSSAPSGIPPWHKSATIMQEMYDSIRHQLFFSLIVCGWPHGTPTSVRCLQGEFSGRTIHGDKPARMGRCMGPCCLAQIANNHFAGSEPSNALICTDQRCDTMGVDGDGGESHVARMVQKKDVIILRRNRIVPGRMQP